MVELPEYVAYCSLDDKSVLRGGNEKFYAYFGNNGYYPLYESIHNEDLAKYLELVNFLKEDEMSREVLRLKDGEGMFHWLVFQMRKRSLASGEVIYDVWLQKVGALTKELEYYKREMKKYRYFLGMLRQTFFEYDIEKEEIKFYWIQQGRELPIETVNYKDWKERCMQKGMISSSSVEVFEQFLENQKDHVEKSSCNISASFLNDEGRMDYLKITGGTIYLDGHPYKIMGRIQVQKLSGENEQQIETIDGKLDSLTGLLNKGEMTRIVKKKIREAGNRRKALCIIDIDDFKQINDQFGHLYGDKVIAVIADVLADAVEGKGICGRFGGDEFFILLEEGTSDEELKVLWRSVRSTVQYLFPNRSEEMEVSISIGISCYPDDGKTYEELFLMADRALYLAKEKGKNRYILYDVKRHGEVQVTPGADPALELSKEKRVINKTMTMCSVIRLAAERNPEKINEMLKLIGESFAIDRVTIFKAEKWDMIYQWTRAEQELTRADYMGEAAYQAQFDEKGRFACNFVMSVDAHLPKAYHYLEERGVHSMFQQVVKRESETYMISYDSCFAKRKWSEDDIHNLTIMNTALEGVLGMVLHPSEQNVIDEE